MGWMVFSQPLYTLVTLCEILQLKKTLVNVLFTDKFLTRHPFGLFESSAKLRKKGIQQKLLAEKYQIACNFRQMNLMNVSSTRI